MEEPIMSSARRPQSTLKESKVQLRLRPAQKELIAQAAQAKQTTLSNFMVEHAMSAAQQVLADQVHFELSAERWEEFCRALDASPKEKPALRKLLTEKSILDGK
jgi:uncharacterized protein (DUF1778 family)